MTPSQTVLTDLRIWNGHRALDANCLVLTGERIEAVCNRGDLPATLLAQAVSLAGATALPGLIDAHVHMVLDPNATKPPEPGAAVDVDAMAERARLMVQAGITSARDLGGGGWHELDLRDAISRGELCGPRLVCSGQPVTCPGGHCHFWGGEAADAKAARQVIERQVQRGANLIKVMATGGRFTKGSAPSEPQFDLATLSAIVDDATRLGRPVAAHCHGSEGIEVAVNAGVHSVEHCSWVGPEGWASDYRPAVASEMARRGTWLSPTINRGWGRMLTGSSKTPGRMGAALKDMRDRAVPLMASTDAGIPGVFHQDLPLALGIFAAVAGMSNEQTLISATSDAAIGTGLGGITGALEAGLAADVLVVDGDPLTDLDALSRPVGVWARGARIAAP